MKIRAVIFGLILVLFMTNNAYSAEKEVLLKTTSTLDNVEDQKLKIKKPEVTVVKIDIGIDDALQMHKHDLVNIAYVKKGTLTVYTDKNEQITVKEGECLPEIIGKYHYGKNTGNEPVELIVFYIGEKDTPLAVNK